jgi:hypothetical protein
MSVLKRVDLVWAREICFQQFFYNRLAGLKMGLVLYVGF